MFLVSAGSLNTLGRQYLKIHGTTEKRGKSRFVNMKFWLYCGDYDRRELQTQRDFLMYVAQILNRNLDMDSTDWALFCVFQLEFATKERRE